MIRRNLPFIIIGLIGILCIISFTQYFTNRQLLHEIDQYVENLSENEKQLIILKKNFESSTLQNQLAETKIKELESRVKRLSDAYDGKSRLATFQTKLDDIQAAEEKCLKRQAIMRRTIEQLRVNLTSIERQNLVLGEETQQLSAQNIRLQSILNRKSSAIPATINDNNVLANEDNECVSAIAQWRLTAQENTALRESLANCIN